MSDTEQNSIQWRVGKHTLPRSEIVFFVQAIFLFVVILACIFNLSREKRQDETLWANLLSLSIGVVVPNPTLKVKKKP